VKRAKVKTYHLPAKDREYLTTNLAQLLKAAVPIGEALQSLAETTKSKQFKRALQQMQQDIDDGLPLWKALDRSGVMSAETLALVRLGEEAGNMVENLEVAAKQEEKQRLFRAKVRSALLYPVFVLTLTAFVGLGVAWFLLPKLSVTFGQLHVQLPAISRIFINLGLFLKRDGIWAVPGCIMLILAGIYVLFAAPKTKHIGNTLLFHVPGIGRLLYEIETARFGYLLGTLLTAGLSVTQALELLEQSTDSRRYRRFYAYLGQSFEEGYGFKASFQKYKSTARFLPPSVQQMIIAGERSGTLPQTLLTVGTTYEAKADISTQNLEVILEPILLVIVALGVLGVAIAVILPIYKLVGGLQGS
jgi:type IV pilus assembly protein PilC